MDESNNEDLEIDLEKNECRNTKKKLGYREHSKTYWKDAYCWNCYNESHYST